MRYADLESQLKKAQAETLKRLRALNEKESLEQIGKRLGFTKGFLSGVLNGRRDPSDQLMRKLLD